MYIEYTPLEGQLHTILKNPTTAAALLAFVEAEEAAAQERAETIGNGVAHRDVASDAARARVAETLPDLPNCHNKPRQFQSEAQKLRAAFEKVRNQSCEEEDDSEYELFDVVETEDQQEITQRDQQLQAKSRNCTGDQNYETNGVEEQTPEFAGYTTQNIEIEIEDEDFVYVLKKVPRGERNRRNPEANIRQKTTGIPSKIVRRPKERLPLPPVLPISAYQDSYFGRAAKARSGLKLLNGNLRKFCPNSQSDESICSSRSNYIYVPRRRPRRAYRKSSLYCRNSGSDEEVEEDYEDFDYIENNNHDNRTPFNRSNAYSVVNNLSGEVPNSQMGIDIVNKIRKLLNFNSSAKTEDASERSRKRRCDDWSPPEAVDVHQIKYRKVDNHFPKFITGPLDDDYVDSFPYPKKPHKPLLLQQHHHFDNYAPGAMSQRKSTLPTDKSMQRRSLFAPPQTIHRLVKNTTYADLEFSDDDEPELVNGFNTYVGKNSNVYHIPITSRPDDGMPRAAASTKAPPPPPLTDGRSGSILASTLLPDVKPYPGYGVTYAEALKRNLIGRDCRYLEHTPTPPSTESTTKTGADFPRPFNNGIADTIRGTAWGTSSRSILAQEKESEERDKYHELLKQLVPSMYGAETSSPPITKASTTARRRSGLMAATGRESPPLVDSYMHSVSRPQSSSLLEHIPRSRNSGGAREQQISSLRQEISMSRKAAAASSRHDIAIQRNEAFISQLEATVRRHENMLRRPDIPTPSRRDISISRYESCMPLNEATARRHENMMQRSEFPLPRPPLSSTINLVDDDSDVKLIGTEYETDRSLKIVRPKRGKGATVIVDDNDISEIMDVIDLEDDYHRQKIDLTAETEDYEREKENAPMDLNKELPYVEPINSLKIQFSSSPHLKENWLENFEKRWDSKKRERKAEAERIEKEAEKHTEVRRAAEAELQERFKNFQFFSPDLVIVDDFPEPAVKKEPEYVQFTPEQEQTIKSAITGAPDEVLVSKFNLNITRRDIHTLLGHNWLNDEVINFYMNLLTERGEKRGGGSDGLPTVYAMNTFFVPRLMQAGHSGVKRWTRKVDIFAKDVIPVPVHVGGVHWCMAIIHLKSCTIKYYDSMGTPNPTILKALEQYLKDESMDKRKRTFDTSHFEIESVPDVPRQMNGSDCGVFSCMFAEFVTRNKAITFSQQQMEYFRQKMILEITQGELLQ